MLADLLAWYNIIFVAAGAMALLFTLLSLIALGSTGDVDVDSDFDSDIDLDADVDVDLDVDVDVDADIDTEVHGGAGDLVAGPVAGFLGFIGLGKVPLSILITIFGYTFGLTGLIANDVFITDSGSVTAAFAMSLGLSSLVSVVSLRLLSGLMHRYLPTLATAVVPRKKLIGLEGEASLPINERVGEVQVYDQFGTLHNLACRVRPGQPEIAKGVNVILVGYQADESFFYVGPSRSRTGRRRG
jgi:hypothetical protein